MNVIVCVKQIPDPALPGRAGSRRTNTLKRDGKLILDESDSYGVEMALQLVDAAGGGEVSLVSMAPERRGRRACARRWPWVRPRPCSSPTRRSQGSDALTTAKVLAAAVQRLGDADLIIAATESTDGYTGTVPEQIAEVLGLPSVTFAKTRRRRRHHAQGRPPDRGGLRRGHLPAAGASSASPPASSSRATRASRGSWPPSRSRSTRSPPPTSASAPVGWAGAGQEIVDVATAAERAGRRDRRRRRRGLPKIVSFLENLKVI